MPMWRCPHCGTPQAETARCWVCRRSSTSCATCRHYRRSVAAKLGYCGLDPRRQPLTGEEIRSCWEGWPAGTHGPVVTSTTITGAHGTDDRPAPLAFVEVDATDAPHPGNAPTAEPGWSLWGDAEP